MASSKALTVSISADEVMSELSTNNEFAGDNSFIYKNAAINRCLQISSFIPIPLSVLNEYGRAECASFIGLLPELQRAWITIDNRLYLWNYASPQECEIYEGVSEIILSVSLAAPKPGMFVDSIKYVLVLATSTEIILLAISCGENGRNLKIIPTSCRMSTDNISVVKIVGSRSGRIFLAGNDGNVYEFVYENVDSPWSVLLGSNRALKCRKINHSVSGWSLSHLLPAFLRGDKGPEDSLVDLSIDDARGLLYSTSCDGSICLYSFRRKFHGTLGPGSSPLIVRNFKILLEALKFSVDQKKKRTTHTDKLDDVQFLSVLRLFVVPITESRSSHAVVLLNNGTRIFLRVYSLRNGSGSDRIPYAFTGDIDTVPVGVEIAYIRNAPPVEMIRNAIPYDNIGNLEKTTHAHGPWPYKFHTSLYTSGLVFLGTERGGTKSGDHLICIYNDDSLLVQIVPQERSSGHSRSLGISRPFRQKCEIVCSPCNSGGYGYGDQVQGIGNILQGMGNIHDIKECSPAIHDAVAAIMLSAYTVSALSSGKIP